MNVTKWILSYTAVKSKLVQPFETAFWQYKSNAFKKWLHNNSFLRIWTKEIIGVVYKDWATKKVVAMLVIIVENQK